MIIENLNQNIAVAKTFESIVNDPNSTKCEIEFAKRQLKLLSSTNSLQRIKYENVIDKQNITVLEDLIEASDYFESRMKNRNTGKNGVVISKAMQVIQAYQNFLGLSYRKAFHSRNQLLEHVTKDGYSYNWNILNKYGIYENEIM